MNTAIIYSDQYLNHKTGLGHPESPSRLRFIMDGVMESGILESGRCSLIKPKTAKLNDLKLIHKTEYISLVRELCKSGGGMLDDGDTILSEESFTVAQLAIGGAIKAVDEVMTHKFRNAFALIRPPGHHASEDHAMGFCIFNNVAAAAAHLLERYNLENVLILDIDAHHGNGTQEIFYSTSRVLYVSLHQDPRGFPNSGFIDEVGVGDGLGYTVNIPLPINCGDPPYWKALKYIVKPISEEYDPQFILVSAGFDGYYGDPVAELSLSAHLYLKIFDLILELADRLCGGRLVAILEGGYKLRFLKLIVPLVIAKMAGFDGFRIRDRRPPLNYEAIEKAEKILEDVIFIQSSFWSL